MRSFSREYVLSVLLALLRMAFVVAGFFLLGCLLVILGIAVYFWLEEPRRLAIHRTVEVSLTETNVALKIIAPQPLQVSLSETNVVIMKPPLEAYLSGAAANAAIWVNGKAFQSGARAAWEMVRDAWRLWLLGAGTLICGLLLIRYDSALKADELRINIPEGAAPNSGPAQPPSKSAVKEGHR